MFSKVSSQFTLPSTLYTFPLLYSYEHFILSNTLFFRQFYGHEMILFCIFLINNDAESLFHVFISQLSLLLSEKPIHVFCSFLYLGSFISSEWFVGVLGIVWTIFPHFYSCKYLFSINGLSFHFLSIYGIVILKERHNTGSSAGPMSNLSYLKTKNTPFFVLSL